MGCTLCKDLFEPVVIDARPRDVVGAAGLSKSMKLEEVPIERQSMAELEMDSLSRTIYRRKRQTFQREGSLDFDDERRRKFRELLSEPCGRFYLNEYARAKKLDDFEARVAFLCNYVKLRDEIRLQESGYTLEKEEEGKERDEDRDARLDKWTQTLVGLINLPPDDPFSILKFANDRETSLMEKARSELAGIALPSVGGPTPSLAERTRTRHTVISALDALYRESFREAVKHLPEFVQHSEYLRYKAKFAQVYNNISHDDFDFMNTLGKGSFGRVIRVRKKTTRQEYAMKIQSKKKILSGAENAAQVTIERNVLVTCNHPSIVKVHFAFHTTRALFLCLDLLEGGTLSHAMHACGGIMPHDAVVFHTAQMTLGLEHLHMHGILFRDLKPLNVMLDRRGNAVLTDMGLACKFRPSQFNTDDSRETESVDVRDQQQPHSASGMMAIVGAGNPAGGGANPTLDGAPASPGPNLYNHRRRDSIPVLPKEKLKCVGTYGFRAPELLATEHERNGYGAAIDYWALGVTVYYLLSNKMPFKTRNQSILEAREKPKDTERRLQKSPPKISTEIHPDAQDLIKGLLRMNPEERYGDSDLVAFKNHPFFKSIDWQKLERRELESPYKPNVRKRDPNEAPQFASVHEAMAQFNNENVLEMFGGEHDIKDEYTHVPRAEQRHFKAWDYIPDAELELEWEIAEKSRIFRRRRTVASSAVPSSRPVLSGSVNYLNNAASSVNVNATGNPGTVANPAASSVSANAKKAMKELRAANPAAGNAGGTGAGEGAAPSNPNKNMELRLRTMRKQSRVDELAKGREDSKATRLAGEGGGIEVDVDVFDDPKPEDYEGNGDDNNNNQ